jgi:hypothetical protein
VDPKTREKKLYEDEVGTVDIRFPDDPDWRYHGGKKEFEERMRELGLLKNDGGPTKELPPAVIEGQEELPI